MRLENDILPHPKGWGILKKMEKEAEQLVNKYKEMRELEKERDKVREELNELNIKVCRIQNEMNDIIEFNTRRM